MFTCQNNWWLTIFIGKYAGWIVDIFMCIYTSSQSTLRIAYWSAFDQAAKLWRHYTLDMRKWAHRKTHIFGKCKWCLSGSDIFMCHGCSEIYWPWLIGHRNISSTKFLLKVFHHSDVSAFVRHCNARLRNHKQNGSGRLSDYFREYLSVYVGKLL